MKTVNFFKKKGGLFSLIASLSFFLVLLPKLTFSEESLLIQAPEQKPLIEKQQPPESGPPVEAQPQPPVTQEPVPPQTPPKASAEVKKPEKAVTEEEKAAPEKPPIKLTLKEAIKTALTGNRPFLDRIDAIKQKQGLGQTNGEQVISVPGAPDIHIPVTSIGLAQAETQFDISFSPTITISRNPDTSRTESFGGLNFTKKFITGGSLSLNTGTFTSSKFQNFSSGSGSVTFNQPLLKGAWPLVVGETVVAAKSDLLKEGLNAECCDTNSRQKLILDVISQYYGIKNQLELVEIAKKAVERATRLSKATEAKLKVELATQLDVSRAEVQLATQQRALAQALQELGNEEEKFKVLLGLKTTEKVELTDEVVYQPSEEIIKEEDLPKFIDTAMKNRPDLRTEQIKVEDADRKLRIARRDLLPSLDSSFTYSFGNVGGLNEAVPSSESWNGSLTLSYPLPLTSTKINIEQSAVALRREERTLVEKKEGINRDIKTDLRNVVKLQEQIAIVKGEIESAEKKLKIANFRFDRGLASNFDIVDAENNLILARQNLTKAIVDYLIAKSQLKRDMGVLAYEE